MTGVVQARVQTELAFRVGGKIIERNVDVGDHVRAGQVLARLDAQEQRNNLVATEAALFAAKARLRQSSADFERQKLLLPKGFTSRSDYEQARAGLRGSESAVKAAEARLAYARDLLGHTQLVSEADGVITSRHAEVGQVVQPATPLFGLAHDGSRDAVFHVYEALFNQVVEEGRALDELEVQVRLLDAPRTISLGRVREVAPTVDEHSGTLQVKVALSEAPEAMGLGSVVSVTRTVGMRQGVILPGSALFSQDGSAAVWVVDTNGRARFCPVRVARYVSGHVMIDQGLESGQRVVVAGGQLLYPGQQVNVVEDSESAVISTTSEPQP